jgi:hypothetical protein
MPDQPISPYSPRSGCSLCTIITNAQPKFSPHPPSGPIGPQYPASPVLPDSQWVSLPLNTPTPVSTGTFLDSPSSPATLSVSSTSNSSPKTMEDGREIVYRDREVTVWTARREKGEALASNGRHLVVAFNAHVESIYELVSAFRFLVFMLLLMIFLLPLIIFQGRQDVPLLLRTMRVASDLLDKVSSSTERKRMGFVVGAVRKSSPDLFPPTSSVSCSSTLCLVCTSGLHHAQVTRPTLTHTSTFTPS